MNLPGVCSVTFDRNMKAEQSRALFSVNTFRIKCREPHFKMPLGHNYWIHPIIGDFIFTSVVWISNSNSMCHACDACEKQDDFKAIVHPKMKFCHYLPPVIPSLHKFVSDVEHKRRYFEEYWRTKQLLVPTDFHSREINGIQWGPSTSELPAFFKISSFMFSIRKKLIQV